MKRLISSLFSSHPVEGAPTKSDRLTYGEKFGELTAQVEALTAERDTLRTHLESARGRMATAEKERDDLKAQLATAKADALAEAEKAMDTRVAFRAQELTASQGVPAISMFPSANPATGRSGIADQYEAISDPAEKMKFFRENKAAILAGR
jgi:hypothetical protein